MLLCQFSFATNDAFVKVIYENYDEIFVLNQIIFIRGIFTLLFILLFLYIKKELNFKSIFTSNELRVRGILESLAALFFFIGIALLPFANVYILLSMAPILLTVFGAIFLREKVRWFCQTKTAPYPEYVYPEFPSLGTMHGHNETENRGSENLWHDS